MSRRPLISLLAIALGLSVGIGHYFWKTSPTQPKMARPVVPDQPACSPAQIELKTWQARIEHESSSQSVAYLRIVGEAVNHCPLSTGVKVRVTAKDKNAEVVESAVRQLGNFRNIPPGAYRYEISAPFEYQPRMASFELEVVEVRQWR